MVNCINMCRKWKFETAKLFSFPLNPGGYLHISKCCPGFTKATHRKWPTFWIYVKQCYQILGRAGTHFEHTFREVKESRSVDSAMCQALLDALHQTVFRIHTHLAIQVESSHFKGNGSQLTEVRLPYYCSHIRVWCESYGSHMLFKPNVLKRTAPLFLKGTLQILFLFCS